MSAYLYVDGLAASISIEALITLLAGCGTVLSIELLPPVESLRMAKVPDGKCRRSRWGGSGHEQHHPQWQSFIVLKESQFNANMQGLLSALATSIG
jgi:hypothetical protein